MLGLSDVVWQALIGAVVTIVIAYFQMKTRKAVEDGVKDAAVNAESVKKTSDQAAVKVEEVATKADTTAVKVAEVKTTLDAVSASTGSQLAELAKVAKETHTLVNNAMSIQLKSNAELSRWKADEMKFKAIQSKSAQDIKAATDACDAADLAEQKFGEHLKKQAIVDAGNSI